MNFADSDPALRHLLDRYLSASNRSRIEPVIAELGTVAAGRLDLLAGVAEVNVPTLRSSPPAVIESMRSISTLPMTKWCILGSASSLSPQ